MAKGHIHFRRDRTVGYAFPIPDESLGVGCDRDRRWRRSNLLLYLSHGQASSCLTERGEGDSAQEVLQTCEGSR
jgi:hypothetical protein